MIDMERAAIMGRLAEARQKEGQLTLSIESYCQTIRAYLNTTLTPAADLEIPTAATQWDALEGTWGELQTVRLEIARLERGLR